MLNSVRGRRVRSARRESAVGFNSINCNRVSLVVGDVQSTSMTHSSMDWLAPTRSGKNSKVLLLDRLRPSSSIPEVKSALIPSMSPLKERSLKMRLEYSDDIPHFVSPLGEGKRSRRNSRWMKGAKERKLERHWVRTHSPWRTSKREGGKVEDRLVALLEME
jgi:hypothetical protein